jgi:hypothetical protein
MRGNKSIKTRHLPYCYGYNGENSLHLIRIIFNDMASGKLFFKLSAEEKESRLRAVLEKEAEIVKAMNLPIIYRNELCVKPNHFIHKYPNGRTELIELNTENAEETVIKVLQEA